jgi:hypothetical protein
MICFRAASQKYLKLREHRAREAFVFFVELHPHLESSGSSSEVNLLEGTGNQRDCFEV